MQTERERRLYGIGYSCSRIDAIHKWIKVILDITDGDREVLTALEEVREINASLREMAEGFASAADDLDDKVWDLERDKESLEERVEDLTQQWVDLNSRYEELQAELQVA